MEKKQNTSPCKGVSGKLLLAGRQMEQNLASFGTGLSILSNAISGPTEGIWCRLSSKYPLVLDKGNKEYQASFKKYFASSLLISTNIFQIWKKDKGWNFVFDFVSAIETSVKSV